MLASFWTQSPMNTRCFSFTFTIATFLAHSVRSSASLHLDVLGAIMTLIDAPPHPEEAAMIPKCKTSLTDLSHGLGLACDMLETETFVLEQKMVALRPMNLVKTAEHWDGILAVWRAQHAALIPTIAMLRALMLQCRTLYLGCAFIGKEDTVDLKKYAFVISTLDEFGVSLFLTKGLTPLADWARACNPKIAEDLRDFVERAKRVSQL